MATLEQLTSRRDAYLAAELRILQSQEYTVGDGGSARRNRRADLETVRQQIAELDRQITAAQATGARRVHYIR